MAANPETKKKIEEVLRHHFQENAYIDVSDGYQDNIHVIVVSNELDEKSEREKQEILWDLIDDAELPESEKTKISLILPLSRSNLK